MGTGSRAPFTKPLTGNERRHIIRSINRVNRQKGRHVRRPNGAHNLDFEVEVQDALAVYEAMTPKARAILEEEVAA